ncbi:MAG: nucleotide-binding enzyme [Alphaproteobacteria bacterium]|nr:nucleotide-binding enzyme [Alphaproteobacteria bacterium]
MSRTDHRWRRERRRGEHPKPPPRAHRKKDGKLERLREQVIWEAARLMCREEVGSYYDAKRMAADRVLGHAGARSLAMRPGSLPSNGEVRAAILLLAERSEGAARRARLFSMRVLALEVMEALEDFQPRLIGSVASGHVRRGSDVDLHVFTEDEDALIAELEDLGLPWRRDRVCIRTPDGFQEYTHVYIELDVVVELSVYAPTELRRVNRSSTDGQPIDRVDAARLEALIAEQHPEAWAAYLEDGERPEVEEGPAPGPWDGLLEEA